MSYREDLEPNEETTSVEYPSTLTGRFPIVVTWQGWWTNGVVREGEDVLGELADEAAFLRGATFVLSDGREFAFRLARGWNGQRYVATIDGRALGTEERAPPETRAGYVLWVVGALSIAGFESAGWLAVVVAAALITLGFLAIRKQRWAALAGTVWVVANAVSAWFTLRAPGGSVLGAVLLSAIAFVLVRWMVEPRE